MTYEIGSHPGRNGKHPRGVIHDLILLRQGIRRGGYPTKRTVGQESIELMGILDRMLIAW
jgi:hypothetical protein